ncbi:MAG: site-specific integrase [Phycisphaerales bacterium]|nr:site-specific integrase [Phycisphaerales bacterium]
MDACPDAEWRLIVALSRYGGLRCPSEHFALRWCDVDWDRGRINVPSPKTAHHAGGDRRAVPLFPELLPYLRDVFERADEGAVHVITRYRDPAQNLRTQFIRIIRRAGLEPWPKLFQNMRSSRETELAERWPLHVVCAWIGNSQAVAAKHYLQVTDEHFERAAMSAPGGDDAIEADESKAVQNPVQQTAERCRKAAHGDCAEADESAFCDTPRGFATACGTAGIGGMGGEGLEPPTSCV